MFSPARSRSCADLARDFEATTRMALEETTSSAPLFRQPKNERSSRGTLAVPTHVRVPHTPGTPPRPSGAHTLAHTRPEGRLQPTPTTVVRTTNAPGTNMAGSGIGSGMAFAPVGRVAATGEAPVRQPLMLPHAPTRVVPTEFLTELDGQGQDFRYTDDRRTEGTRPERTIHGFRLLGQLEHLPRGATAGR